MTETRTLRVSSLLECLLQCSEKAAKIAQIFREDKQLFELLIEEKTAIVIGKRFVHDFKTLADVLVQVTIKREIGKKFPKVTSKVQGEEVSKFQNVLGESIEVEITDSYDETVSLLSTVLDGNTSVAESLATIVHAECEPCKLEDSSSSCISEDEIGIWIDPIDSTAEYIKAKHQHSSAHVITQYGLDCVCVLIGVYNLETGFPVMGVINQPFHRRVPNTSKWESKFYWGVSCGPEKVHSILNSPIDRRKKIIVTSGFEQETLQDIMKTKYEIVHVAGAGYKSLLVACADADLYVLSSSSTHFWDVCGPHAILRAQGGGLVNFKNIVAARCTEDLEKYQVKYLYVAKREAMGLARNSDGIIAYRDPQILIEFLGFVQETGYQIDSPNHST